MEHFYEKLADALEEIKTTCENADKCKTCPLSSIEGQCLLEVSPKRWIIDPNKPDDKIIGIYRDELSARYDAC